MAPATLTDDDIQAMENKPEASRVLTDNDISGFDRQNSPLTDDDIDAYNRKEAAAFKPANPKSALSPGQKALTSPLGDAIFNVGEKIKSGISEAKKKLGQWDEKTTRNEISQWKKNNPELWGKLYGNTSEEELFQRGKKERDAVLAALEGGAEQLTFGAYNNKEAAKNFPLAYGAGEIAGGIGSFVATGGALKALGLANQAVKAGQAALAVSRLGPRFVPSMIMTGATFGTHSGINEAVAQAQEGRVNLAELGMKVAKDTAFGATLGAVGRVANVPVSVTTASGLGFLSAKLDGADDKQATLNGAMWGGFEVIGSFGKNNELKVMAMNNIRRSLADYAQAAQKGMGRAEAESAADAFLSREAQKLGGMDKVLESRENSLRFLEEINQNIFKKTGELKAEPGSTAPERIPFEEQIKTTDVGPKKPVVQPEGGHTEPLSPEEMKTLGITKGAEPIQIKPAESKAAGPTVQPTTAKIAISAAKERQEPVKETANADQNQKGMETGEVANQEVKESTNDRQDIERLQGGGQEGQAPVKAEPIQEPSTKTLAAGGVLQASKENAGEIKSSRPEDFATAEEYVASKKLELIKPSEDIGVFSKPEHFDSGESGTSNRVEFPSKDRPLLQGRDYGSIVYRDNSGKPQGVLTFKLNKDGGLETKSDLGSNVEVFVNPEYRRQGIATKLYEKAKELGFDTGKVEGMVFTKAGLALEKARLSAEWEATQKNKKAVKETSIEKRKLAHFKIRVGQNWKVPVANLPKNVLKPGIKLGTQGSLMSMNPPYTFKGVDSDKAIFEISNSLDEVKIEKKHNSELGDYVEIAGYPKPVKPGDKVITTAYGLGGGASAQGTVFIKDGKPFVRLADGREVEYTDAWIKKDTGGSAPQSKLAGEQISDKNKTGDDQQNRISSSYEQGTINNALAQAKPPIGPTDPVKTAKNFDGEFSLPDEVPWEAFRRVVEDFNIRLKTLNNEIAKKTLEPVKEIYDLWAQKDMLPRKQADLIRRIRNEKREFVKELVRDGVSVSELDRFLHALHAKERNAQMKKQLIAINKPAVEGLSGMTDEEATEIIKKANSKLWKYVPIVHKMNDDILVFEVGEGMMKPEEADKIRAMYKNYVPLFRDVEEDYTGIGMGTDIRGQEFKKAVGSKLRVTSPLGNVFAQKERVYVRALKNKVGRTIVKMVEEYPFLEKLFFVEREPMGVVGKTVRKAEIDQQFVDNLTDFAKSLGLRIFETKARLQGGALGLYWPGWRGVQRRFATSRETLAHEIGHFIDDKYSLKQRFYKNRKDTRAVGQEIYVHSEKEVGESDNRLKKPEERFANAFSWWLTHRDLAKQSMPLFDKAMNGIIAEIPELKPLLDIRPTARPSSEQITEDVWGRVDRVGNDVVGTKIDGAQYYITISDQGVANALKNINLARIPRYIQMLRTALGVWSGFKTRWRPEFIMTNFERDLGEALINLGVEKGILADKSGNLRMDIVRNLFASQRQVWRYLRGAQDAEVDEFFKLGGDTGHFWIETAKQGEETLIQLEKELKNEGAIVKLANAGKSALDFVDAINSMVELGVRLSTYKQLVARGFSKERAIQSAADLTVNFSRQGEVSPLIKSFYGFINPAIQGTSKVFRSITSPQGRGRVAKAVTALTLFGFLVRYLSIMFDDEGDEQIPEWSKNNKISFAIGNGNQINLWSLPYGFTSFYSLGSNMASVVHGKKTMEEALGSFMNTAANSFSPFGTKLNDLVPTLARPIFDINQNKGWHGGMIRPDQVFTKTPKPNSQVYFDRTAQSYVFIAQVVNRLTGGSGSKAGLIDINPNDLQYLYDQYFGGPFEFATSTIEAGARGINGEFDPNETPFVRQIFREGKPQQFSYGVIYDTLEKAYKKDVSPLEKDRFFYAIDVGLESKVFDKDKAQGLTQDFLKAVYKIEGPITSRGSVKIIKAMPEDDRNELLNSYGRNTRHVIMRGGR